MTAKTTKLTKDTLTAKSFAGLLSFEVFVTGLRD
jgi:hypothetical protein